MISAGGHKNAPQACTHTYAERQTDAYLVCNTYVYTHTHMYIDNYTIIVVHVIIIVTHSGA